jgi:hypothetical protein
VRRLTQIVQERAALEVVAKRFSATWEQGSGPPDAYLMVTGKRVAVDIRTFKRRGAGQRDAAKLRLRFDKVATRLLERLRTTLGDIVPDGTAVVLTVTAPIRVAAKTAAALEDRIPTLLARRSPGRDEKATIHGNRIQIRLLRNQSARAPRFIGFVHNADSDPLLLLNMTREFLELISAETDARATRRVGDRWLVVTSDEGSSLLEAYRDIYSQLRKPTGFAKILMAFGDGRVGELTG